MKNLIKDIIKQTLKSGASDVDVVISNNQSSECEVRSGKVEKLVTANNNVVGIRAFIDKKSAIVTTNNLEAKNVAQFCQRAAELAKASPEDALCSLASKDEFTQEIADLDLYDEFTPSEKQLIEQAAEAEEAALENPQINKIDSASSSYSKSHVYLATSKGFAGNYKKSYFSTSLSPIAESNGEMQRDYDYDVKCKFADLKSPSAIGKIAAERTVKKLNGKKIASCQIPVIFENRIAKSLIGYLASAINGISIAKGTSFLAKDLGKEIFNKNINIIDNPSLLSALGSQPFDAEGIAGEKLDIIKNGTLSAWLLDIRSSKQLNIANNGRATRSASSPPSPSSTNFYMENGDITFADMLKSIKKGLLVTETFGMGVNLVTGDYSQGAGGFMIENGVITHAVSEITIAGNLRKMFAEIIPANDLELQGSMNAPSLLLETSLTIAGS
jgi:PmbA protein